MNFESLGDDKFPKVYYSSSIRERIILFIFFILYIPSVIFGLIHIFINNSLQYTLSVFIGVFILFMLLKIFSKKIIITKDRFIFKDIFSGKELSFDNIKGFKKIDDSEGNNLGLKLLEKQSIKMGEIFVILNKLKSYQIIYEFVVENFDDLSKSE